MRLLVLDTALTLCTAAVFQDGRALAFRSEPMAKGHQERIAGLVRDVVAESGGFDAIDRIGATVGPGSFTGLRVGLAFAQGLGAALDRPVVGVSTLDALAASAPGAIEAGRPVAALIDARRGQVYARFWGGGEPIGPPQPLPLAEAAERLDDLGRPFEEALLMIGSGAALFADRCPQAERRPLDGPTPEALARLAAGAHPDGSLTRPLYLRAPDATPPTRLPGQARPARP